MFVTIQNVVLMLLREMSLNVAHAVGLVIKQSAEKKVTTACCYHFTPLTLHYSVLLATKKLQSVSYWSLITYGNFPLLLMKILFHQNTIMLYEIESI